MLLCVRTFPPHFWLVQSTGEYDSQREKKIKKNKPPGSKSHIWYIELRAKRMGEALAGPTNWMQ